MYEHHRKAMDNLVELLKPNPSFLAVITAGSVAQNKAKETSDVDVYLLVDDEEFERRKAEDLLAYTNHDVCDYPEGYIDGKIINLHFLESASEHGSEPTRASFVGSKAYFSRIPDLDNLLARISVYPEKNRERDIKDFYAQIYLYAFYFAGEAAKKDNTYLKSHAASNLVLFSGRVILTHNRILFPCHKGLIEAVTGAAEKPDNFVEQVNSLLLAPTFEKCMDFAKMMLAFKDPGISFDQAISRFVENNEWNWLTQEPPLQDR
ncbi:hypothetical protein ACIFQM_03400 [Paenibacillus sp. NRS-1782]|uniref:hypothetical protein n=1 Tax=unclassified Paenibacillus TaxID=185978 RepID=UPI003D2BF306